MMSLIDIEEEVIKAIPIYTLKKPNPKSGKPDCNITVREKEHFREIMRIKLRAAKDEEKEKQIIEHYKRLFNG